MADLSDDSLRGLSMVDRLSAALYSGRYRCAVSRSRLRFYLAVNSPIRHHRGLAHAGGLGFIRMVALRRDGAVVEYDWLFASVSSVNDPIGKMGWRLFC